MKQYAHSEKILRELSLKTKESKGRPPSTKQIWLGKEYDTIKQWVKLPDSKVNRYVQGIESVIASKYISARKLLSHVGRTRHMGTVYRPLNAFARGLEAWVYSKKSLDAQITISPPIIRDLELCIWGMNQANQHGVSFDHFIQSLNSPDITFHTDASLKVGIGAISDKGHYIQHRWDDFQLHQPNKKDIVWRELVAVYVTLHALQKEINNNVVHLYTDNMGVKWMLINMRSKLYRPDLQVLINEICKLCITTKCHLWMEYISTTDNVIADSLSRYKANPFKNETRYTHKINAASWLQKASNLTKNIKIKHKYLKFIDK